MGPSPLPRRTCNRQTGRAGNNRYASRQEVTRNLNGPRFSFLELTFATDYDRGHLITIEYFPPGC